MGFEPVQKPAAALAELGLPSASPAEPAAGFVVKGPLDGAAAAGRVVDMGTGKAAAVGLAVGTSVDQSAGALAAEWKTPYSPAAGSAVKDAVYRAAVAGRMLGSWTDKLAWAVAAQGPVARSWVRTQVAMSDCGWLVEL